MEGIILESKGSDPAKVHEDLEKRIADAREKLGVRGVADYNTEVIIYARRQGTNCGFIGKGKDYETALVAAKKLISEAPVSGYNQLIRMYVELTLDDNKICCTRDNYQECFSESD